MLPPSRLGFSSSLPLVLPLPQGMTFPMVTSAVSCQSVVSFLNGRRTLLLWIAVTAEAVASAAAEAAGICTSFCCLHVRILVRKECENGEMPKGNHSLQSSSRTDAMMASPANWFLELT